VRSWGHVVLCVCGPRCLPDTRVVRILRQRQHRRQLWLLRGPDDRRGIRGNAQPRMETVASPSLSLVGCTLMCGRSGRYMYKPDMRNTCCRLYAVHADPFLPRLTVNTVIGRFGWKPQSSSQRGSIERISIASIGISKAKSGTQMWQGTRAASSQEGNSHHLRPRNSPETTLIRQAFIAPRRKNPVTKEE
jgi:Arginine-tRNA-protein transferase, N terminus